MLTTSFFGNLLQKRKEIFGQKSVLTRKTAKVEDKFCFTTAQYLTFS